MLSCGTVCLVDDGVRYLFTEHAELNAARQLYGLGFAFDVFAGRHGGFREFRGLGSSWLRVVGECERKLDHDHERQFWDREWPSRGERLTEHNKLSPQWRVGHRATDDHRCSINRRLQNLPGCIFVRDNEL